MIIRASKVTQKSQPLQPINMVVHQPIKPPPRGHIGGVGVLVFALPSASLTIFLSLFSLNNTSFCLSYSCPHLSLWETENSQSHNYRTELSISPSINPVGREGTRERKERAEKGMRDSNLGSRDTLVCSSFPQGCSHVFGLRRERITPPPDELDPATGGQTSYYTAKAPYAHYQQIGLATVPLMQTVC